MTLYECRIEIVQPVGTRSRVRGNVFHFATRDSSLEVW